MIISGIDFHKDLSTRPEARQLLFSLQNYMLSEKFNPVVRLDIDTIQALIR
jgi:hypothetical protein